MIRPELICVGWIAHTWNEYTAFGWLGQGPPGDLAKFERLEDAKAFLDNLLFPSGTVRTHIPRPRRECPVCKLSFELSRKDRLFCSARCKAAFHRKKGFK